MKFSGNCQEMKGPFGGTYYELTIKVTLTDAEIQAARKYKQYHATLIGIDSDERRFLYSLTSAFPAIQDDYPEQSLSIEKLSNGITLKAKNADQLPDLLQFEALVKERCKKLKEYFEARQDATDTFGKGGAKYEEEL